MIPHEKTLVKRYCDRPFVLLGVNSDKDKQQYRRMAKSMGVTWRSAWLGSSDHELLTSFGIRQWPTLLLIDAEGTVQEFWEGLPEDLDALDRRIEELVTLAER